MSPRRHATAALWLLVAFSRSGGAQWQVEEEVFDGDPTRRKVAVVNNDSGHSVRIYNDGSSAVRVVFALPDGFDTLSRETCPTFRVDHGPPQVAEDDRDRCGIEPRRASFTMGRVADGRVRSNALFWIMNGTRLLFRYRLEHVGYRETAFSLRGSKQVLREAIGLGIRVIEE